MFSYNSKSFSENKQRIYKDCEYFMYGNLKERCLKTKQMFI